MALMEVDALTKKKLEMLYVAGKIAKGKIRQNCFVIGSRIVLSDA